MATIRDAALFAAADYASRPESTFYTEDVCDLRDEPGHIGVVERTTSDVDTHAPHPHVEWPNLRCHKDISREAYQKFKHDGIPPENTVLVVWQTKKFSELIPTRHLVLLDRALIVGDVVKRSPTASMSGTITQTSMDCVICPSAWKESRIDRNGAIISPPMDMLPISVTADDLKLANNYKDGDLVILQDWVGRITYVIDEVVLRLADGAMVAVDEPMDLHNLVDDDDSRLDVGAIASAKKATLRRGRWISGRFDPRLEPRGDVMNVRPITIDIRWLWRRGADSMQMMLDHPSKPADRISVTLFESLGGKLYDPARSPRHRSGVHKAHTAFMAGDKVRFTDVAGAAVKYPDFKPIPTSDTNGFDLNVFTILFTNTKASVLWQDCSEEQLPGTELFPDYNLDDDHEVWPGEIVITNEKIETDEDWIFQPKRVGVVQSVVPDERVARVKWLPKASVQYNQIGLDEHLDEISLLAGSTLALDKCAEVYCPIEEVVLYDVRTIGALTRRRGDFVVIEENFHHDRLSSAHSDEFRWFGEVINLNLDGTLTIRLGAAKEVEDVRVSPEYTRLVHSSDAPSFMGDEGYNSSYDSEDGSGDLAFDDDDEDMTSDSYSEASGESVWTLNGEPIQQDDDEWEDADDADDNDLPVPHADAQDTAGDVEMEDVSPTENGQQTRQDGVDVEQHQYVADEGVALALEHIPLQESSISNIAAEGAPSAFDVLDTYPPLTNTYIHPEPPALTGARLKRIRKEHSILSTSLPEGIFVRTWESRLDLIRVLIVGPLGTPYEFAPYVIDIRVPPDYPSSPPEAYFHSWTSGQGPINPNLYENGKICLSLLGTWHAGEKGEAWNPARSTILQVLVSILGLVLVKEPYYNEAGYEARAGSEDAKVPSQLYSEKAYFTSRAFISHAIRNGVEGFDDVLKWLYTSKDEHAPGLLAQSISAARELIQAGDGREDVRAGLKRMSRGAIIMLKRQLQELEELERAQARN